MLHVFYSAAALFTAATAAAGLAAATPIGDREKVVDTFIVTNHTGDPVMFLGASGTGTITTKDNIAKYATIPDGQSVVFYTTWSFNDTHRFWQAEFSEKGELKTEYVAHFRTGIMLNESSAIYCEVTGDRHCTPKGHSQSDFIRGSVITLKPDVAEG